jgi:hypothetical protein
MGADMILRRLPFITAALASALAAESALAQLPHPDAVPRPDTYQGSMELQRQSDEQDRRFREQQQQQQQQFQQQLYDQQQRQQPSGARGAGGGARAGSAAPAPLTPLQKADLDAIHNATTAMERKDYATAMRLLRPVADHGGLLSQYNLALMYEQGLGAPKNYAMALSLYHRSAEQGFAGAMLNLGTMYGLGEGVPVNDVEAYKWFTLAIPRYSPSQGDAKAQAAHNRDFVAKRMTRTQIAQAQTLARTSTVPFIR